MNIKNENTYMSVQKLESKLCADKYRAWNYFVLKSMRRNR